MTENRITEDEVGTMLEEAFEGEPFKRVEPPPRFGIFFRRPMGSESFVDRLKRFLAFPSMPRRLVFSGTVVAILLVVLVPLMPDAQRMTYRDSGALEAVELPRGRLHTAPVDLQWPDLKGTVAWRVELVDPEGTLLWQAAVDTCRAGLPDDLFAGRAPGVEYTVRVTGLGPDGAEVGRQSSRFIILP